MFLTSDPVCLILNLASSFPSSYWWLKRVQINSKLSAIENFHNYHRNHFATLPSRLATPCFIGDSPTQRLLVPSYPNTKTQGKQKLDMSLMANTASSSQLSFRANFNYYIPLAKVTSELNAEYYNALELIHGLKDNDTRLLPVHDIRGRESDFSLDTTGFCIIKHASVEKAFTDEAIQTVYYPEVEQLLKRQFQNLTRVVLLPHLMRSTLRRTDFSGPAEPAWNLPVRGVPPVPRVHVDFTRRGTHLALAQELGEQDALSITASGRRYLVISVWRPIKPVRRDPLGVCDGATVDDEDLEPLPRLYPDGQEGENIIVNAGKEGVDCSHKWYWMSNQQPDEVLLIKIFDSETANGRVMRSPHASFEIECDEDEPPRESIEIRAVLCF